MHFNGLQRRAIAMKTESCRRKTLLSLQALIFLAFYSVASGFFIYRYHNARQLNKALCA